jgi:hypothetical protein
MELIVKVIDIRYNKNKDILNRNADLSGYAYFVSQVNNFQKKGMDLESAITTAADICIKKGILYDILIKLKDGELVNMAKFEYDEKVALKVARKEGEENGIAKGIAKGIKIGEKKNKEEAANELISRMLANGMSAESISSFAEIPLAKILKVKNQMPVNA